MEHKYTEVYILPKNDSNRLLLGKVSSKKNGSEYSHSYLDSQYIFWIFSCLVPHLKVHSLLRLLIFLFPKKNFVKKSHKRRTYKYVKRGLGPKKYRINRNCVNGGDSVGISWSQTVCTTQLLWLITTRTLH